MKCQNSAKVNGFKRCIDEFVGLKQVKKTEVKYMQAWEEKLLERQKEKRELLRK